MHGVTLIIQTSNIAPKCSFPMGAEILNPHKALKKPFFIWCDHVTVILHGYIKYKNGVEYKYL